MAVRTGWRYQLAGLFGEIHQNRAGFKYADGFIAISVAVDDGGNPVVRAEGEKFRLELITLTDIDPVDLVIQSEFLKRN